MLIWVAREVRDAVKERKDWPFWVALWLGMYGAMQLLFWYCNGQSVD